MKKITLLGLLAILAISVEGCTIGETDKKTTNSQPPSNTKNLAENQNQSTEEAEETNTARPQRVSGLIPATNPDVRVSGNARGRRDPFALVNIRPEIEKNERDRSGRNGKSASSRGSNKGVPTLDDLNSQANGADNQALNSEFLPSLAEQVIVTGIVRLGGRTKVIVKAPEEAVARHVNIGERVSNGLVLIKRVEGLNSPTPKVVLEHKGIEIKKGVGELPSQEGTGQSDLTVQVIDKSHDRSWNKAKTWLPNFLSQKLKDSKNN